MIKNTKYQNQCKGVIIIIIRTNSLKVCKHELLRQECVYNGRNGASSSFSYQFNVYGSVHRKYIPIDTQQDSTLHKFIYIWKLFYMFRVVPPPIIRNANNCI